MQAIANRMAHVAWILGVQNSEWPTAAQFVANVREDVIHHVDEFSQQCLRAVVRLAPIITATSALQRDREIRALIVRYPLVADTLRRFISLPTVPTAPRSKQAPPATAKSAVEEEREHDDIPEAKPVPRAAKPPLYKEKSHGWLIAITLSVGAVGITTLIMRDSLPSQVPRVVPTTTSFSPQATLPGDSVQMTGRDGARFRVSYADYLRLLPIYDELKRRKVDIDQRADVRRRVDEEIDAARLALDRKNELSVAAFDKDSSLLASTFNPSPVYR